MNITQTIATSRKKVKENADLVEENVNLAKEDETEDEGIHMSFGD